MPGPADRASFFEEQMRHRRSTWKLGALCVVAVLAMGIPVSLVVTPVLFAALLVAAHVINLFVPIPDTLGALGDCAGWPDGLLARTCGPTVRGAPRALLILSLVLGPGMAATLGLWLGLRAVFARAGVGGLLTTLGTRPPREDDLEERQLGNLIEEMAIAAGIPPPRLVLLDSPVPNAAAIGGSPDDAVLVVSRRIIDDLDRDETQGLVAHLVASIGNGDLRVAWTILSVLRTFGLLVTILSAPFSSTGRRAIGRLVRFAITRRDGADARREGETIGAMLTAEIGASDSLDAPEKMTWLLAPLTFVGIAAKWTVFVFVSFLIGPLIAFLWRARRYLADATAVQLTRYPDGLARALVHLAEAGAVIPGSRHLSHLFVIGAEAASERAQRRFMQTAQEMRERADHLSFRERYARIRAAQREQQEATAASMRTIEGTLGAGSVISFHPPLSRRLERLRALGARVEHGQADLRRTLLQSVGYYVAVTLVGVLWAAAVAACLAGVALIVGLAVVAMAFFIAALHWVLTLVGTAVAFLIHRAPP